MHLLFSGFTHYTGSILPICKASSIVKDVFSRLFQLSLFVSVVIIICITLYVCPYMYMTNVSHMFVYIIIHVHTFVVCLLLSSRPVPK